MDDKRILKEALEIFSHVPEERRDGVCEAFVDLVKIVDENPQRILEQFHDNLTREERLQLRTLCAEHGWEILPDDVQVIIDLYKIGYMTWEKLKFEETE